MPNGQAVLQRDADERRVRKRVRRSEFFRPVYSSLSGILHAGLPACPPRRRKGGAFRQSAWSLCAFRSLGSAQGISAVIPDVLHRGSRGFGFVLTLSSFPSFPNDEEWIPDNTCRE